MPLFVITRLVAASADETEAKKRMRANVMIDTMVLNILPKIHSTEIKMLSQITPSQPREKPEL